MKYPNFIIKQDTPGLLLLVDVGPWEVYPTITNRIEDVVSNLYQSRHLEDGKALEYIDSDGGRTHVLHSNGEFDDFGKTYPDDPGHPVSLPKRSAWMVRLRPTPGSHPALVLPVIVDLHSLSGKPAYYNEDFNRVGPLSEIELWLAPIKLEEPEG